MKVFLLKTWERARSSFWFIPGIMAAAAFFLAIATVELDREVSDVWLTERQWIYAGGAEGATAVLSVIAGSMMTITGLVFSLTLVGLSLASSQFGPRLLRNFMRDTMNQVVLGVFVATFLYCLLVLRTIRLADEVAFVPHLSVTLGVIMALICIGVLIFYIHHISVSIQADEIIARVANELNAGIDRLFPVDVGNAPPRTDDDEQPGLTEEFFRECEPILADQDGYIEYVDANVLLAIAVKHELIIKIDHRPGQYVFAERPLASVWPSQPVDEKLAARIRGAFIQGSQRTPSQDVEFTVFQLVEIAARALSPGINDPFTAITCVDRLGSALSRLASRSMPSAYRFDDARRLRVVAPAPTFAGIADAAFNIIRQCSRGNAALTIRLLETVAGIAPSVHRSGDQTALRLHAEMLIRSAREALPEEEDRKTAEERYQEARHALKYDVELRSDDNEPSSDVSNSTKPQSP